MRFFLNNNSFVSELLFMDFTFYIEATKIDEFIE